MEDEIERLEMEIRELEGKLKVALEDRSALLKKLEEVEKCQHRVKEK
ncbi:MAG: hypothetical protein ACP5UO_02495 [Thermoplasmata archaeon]